MLPLMNSGETSIEGYVLYITAPIYMIFILYSIIAPLANLKTIIIEDISITYKYLLMKKKYNLKEIDGYFTMELPSRDNTYETIYPVRNNTILPPIDPFIC